MKKVILATLAAVGLTTTAWAHSPDLDQMAKVKAAAHDLERAAHHVRESAGHWRGTALDELEKKSSHFHRQVEKHRKDPAHTEDDFAALAEAYFHARNEIHHMDSHVRDDFRDVEAHMHTLMDFYGGKDVWDQRQNRH